MNFVLIAAQLVTQPLYSKNALVDCYDNTNTLQIYPADKRACIALAPKPQMSDLCTLERGVKAALTLSTVSYYMNTTIADFSFYSTSELCFSCDAGIDANGCAQMKAARLAKVTIEGVHDYIAPSVTVIKRQQMNMLKCFAHSGTLQSGAYVGDSYYVIDYHEIEFHSLVLQECDIIQGVPVVNQVEITLSSTKKTQMLTVLSFTNDLELGSTEKYLKTTLQVSDDLYAFVQDQLITNCTLTLSVLLNGEIAYVYDYSQIYYSKRYKDTFSSISMKVLATSVDVLTIQLANPAEIDSSNQLITQGGFDAAAVRIIIFPYTSTLPQIIEFYLSASKLYFSNGELYHFGCADQTSLAYESCLGLLGQLLATDQNKLFTIMQFEFRKSGIVGDIATLKITDYSRPCFSQLVLYMRLDRFELDLTQNSQQSQCTISEPKAYMLGLYVRGASASIQRLAYFEEVFSSQNSTVRFDCGEECSRWIDEIKASPNQFFIIHDPKDSSMFEQYNVDQIYYVDFSRTYKYCFITFGVEFALIFVFGLIIIYFKQRIARLCSLKRKRGVQLKEVDDL